MGLRAATVRTFHRTLYAGILESVTLLKRHDDQAQGTVDTHRLFQCRWSMIFKQGQTLGGEMLASHTRVLHIPRIELDRIGVHYINPTDRFIDKDGRTWQPESPTQIIEKLFEQHVCVQCKLVDGRDLHG